MARKFTALVLQGGGALGAFEFGVVKALYEQKGFAPDVVTGVSIGAISASVLVGAKAGPVEGLAKLWDMLTIPEMPFTPDKLQLMLAMPCNPAMYTLNLNYFLAPNHATSLCSTAPLHTTLGKLIDLDKMNSPESPALIVTATNIRTGMIEEFSTRQQRLSFDHIVASGSLPPSFPMTRIGEDYYWDGGLFSNTPLAGAINALEQLGDDEDEREVIIVELFPQAGDVPKNMNDVSNRMSQLSFECKLSGDFEQYKRLDEYIDMARTLDKELPADSAVRQSAAFKRLMGYRKIDRVSVIRHSEPELMTGGADFTQKSVERRIEQGYKDAKAFLANG